MGVDLSKCPYGAEIFHIYISMKDHTHMLNYNWRSSLFPWFVDLMSFTEGAYTVCLKKAERKNAGGTVEDHMGRLGRLPVELISIHRIGLGSGGHC